MALNDLQAKIDATAPGGTLAVAPPFEREGPLVLRHKLVLEGGSKAAIWSRTSPVVSVGVTGSVLRDIRVEYTGSDVDGCALELLADRIELRNVTVRGNILGIAGESGHWRYPHQLYFGKLEPDRDIEFRLRLVAPVACRLRSEVEGISISPDTLMAGFHEVVVRIDGLRRDTLIYGSILIETPGLKREIAVNGHAVPPGGPDVAMFAPGHVVWQPADWDALQKPPGRAVPERPRAESPPPPIPVSPPVDVPSALPVAPTMSNPTRPTRMVFKPAGLGGAFAAKTPPVPVSAPVAVPVASGPAAAPVPDPEPEPPKPKKKGASISSLFGQPPAPPQSPSEG